MSAASEQARAFAEAWRANPQNSDVIYSLMKMQGPTDAREVVEYQVSATLLDQLADEVEQAAASRVEALNRAFGSRTGDTPRFTAEAEGDDYLFGRAPRAVNTALVERGTGAALATLTDHETGAGSDLRPGDIDLDDDTYIEIHGRIDIRQLVREILEATR